MNAKETQARLLEASQMAAGSTLDEFFDRIGFDKATFARVARRLGPELVERERKDGSTWITAFMVGYLAAELAEGDRDMTHPQTPCTGER